MPRPLTLFGIAVALASAGAFGWHAWDTGMIPGNPRAPLPKNFEAALRVALNDAVPEDPLCNQMNLYGIRGETYRMGGVQNMPNQGLYTITLAHELGGQERVKQIAMFEGLAKAGIFSAKDTAFEDESGTQRKARTFRLTPNGWLQMSSADCLWLGRREFSGITKFAKLNAADGAVAYEITYEVKLAALPAWAQQPDAAALYPRLAEFKNPLERRAQLVRTQNGWTAKLAKIVPRGSDANRDAPPVYVDANPGLKPPPAPNLEDASKLVAASSQAGALTACLNLPVAHMADGVGDFQNQDREKPYFATYYDDPSKNPAQPTGRADGLALMRALQKIGMVDEEPADDIVFNGQRRPGGATFRLKQTYKVLMDPRQPGCLPIATLAPEVKVVRDTRTAAAITGQTAHYVEIRGVSRAANLMPWVKETGADKELDFVRMIVDEGLPLGGMLHKNANTDWQASSVTAPRLVYQSAEAPKVLFAMLPRLTGAPRAGASETHAVIVYEGPAARAQGQQFSGSIAVTVGRTARPVELFLSAYNTVDWKLTLEAGAQLKRIVAVGYSPQQVSGAPRNVPVETSSAQMGQGAGRYLPFASAGSGNEAQTISALKAMTTAPIASVQTAYRGTYFPVGEVRSAPPASAHNIQSPNDVMAIERMPRGYSYGAPPPVVAVPYGGQGSVQGSAVQAVPALPGGVQIAPYGGTPGSAARARIAGQPPALSPHAAPPTAARELRRMRCGSSTIVCEAGSTAMCEGKPVACN